jgi:general secretion pathway protein D
MNPRCVRSPTPKNRQPIYLLGLCIGLSLLLVSCSSPLIRKGDRAASEGQWDQAVASYREALKKDPFNPKIQASLDEARAHAGGWHYNGGRQALDEHRLADALREFKEALAFDPSKQEHHEGMAEALRLKEARDYLESGGKLVGLGRSEEALAIYERAVELDPSLTQALEAITQITKQQRAEKSLVGSSQPITLRFQNAKLKEVFEILARTAGVNVIFDKEVRDDPITIFVKDLPFDEALNLILSTNNLLTQRIGSDTLLVMPNSKQKQAQYQDLLLRTFYLANAKAKDAVNLVRTMLDSKKIYVDEKINAIVVRDEPAKLQLAERMLFAIDRREPEIELDLEVLEVNRTKSLKYGLNFAKQAGLGLIPGGGSGGISTSPTQFTFQQLTSIGPGSYLFRLPASVLIDFFKQDSDAKTLASPKLRVINNKSASINIGDKQPILLSTTNVLPGQAATGAIPTTSTVTSIEFKDTGVKLTVEPSINLMDEVTMKLKVEVTRLGDQVILQASPEIRQFKFGTRSAETTLSLKDGETVVLAGLIQDEERKSRSSVPLLGDIPILGQLLTSTTEDVVQTEVVLTLTPRVVRSMGAPPMATQAMWSGTENAYATTQLFPPRAMKVSQDLPSVAALPKMGTEAKPAAGGGSTQPVVIGAGAPATGLVAPAMQTNPEPHSQAKTESIARLPPPVTIRPVDVAATAGQEFRLDVLALQGQAMTEAIATVLYDPKLVEFRRVGPGAAAISARATDGQVQLTVRRQGGADQGDTVLAMMFFQAKIKGDATVTLQATAGGVAAPAGPVAQEQVVVHVQ